MWLQETNTDIRGIYSTEVSFVVQKLYDDSKSIFPNTTEIRRLIF